MKAKNLLQYFFIFSLYFFLSPLAHAEGTNGKSEILFFNGLENYQQSQYTQAFQKFTGSIKQNANYQPSYHYAGLSLFKQKKYNEALSYFQNAIKLDPKDGASHLFLGLCYLNLKQNDKAITPLKTAVQTTKDENVKNLASSNLKTLGVNVKTVSQAAASKPWFAFASLGSQYDSNVSLNPENITIASLPSDKADSVINLYGGGGLRVIKHKNYNLWLNSSYYQSLHTNLTDFNYGLFHADLTDDLNFKKVGFQFKTGYDFSLLASDKYLQSITLEPSTYITLCPKWQHSFKTSFRRDLFFADATTAAQERDAWNINFTSDETFFFTKARKSGVTVGYGLERNFSTGADWAYWAHSINTSFFAPLFWDINLYLFGKFTVDKSFDNTDSIILSKREDWGVQSGISLSRKIAGALSASVNYTFTHNDSNQSFFEYNKHVAGLQLSLSY